MFKDFTPKKADRLWLCASVTLVPKAVESCSRLKKLGKTSSLHSKKFFWSGEEFFVSDIISGGLSGHLGPLHLALDPNC